MSEHMRSRETAALPDRVWSIWSNPATWPTWNPDVEWINLDGPFATGTTGRMKTKAGGQHQITLASVEPGRAFQLETSVLPGSRFAFRCEIVPTGGGSRISQAIRMQGPLAPLFSRMMGPRIAESFGPILDGLARQAESSAAA
jgi:uncharacterized protein YndB with AHSA1/START domain